MRIGGAIPPVPTFFKEDMELDPTAQRLHTERLVEAGVNGIVALGSTGEFTSLTKEERRRVVEVCVDAANGRVPVIAGTGAPSFQETLSLSKDAEDAGADALIVVTPFYLRTSEEGLKSHYHSLSRRINLPVILYAIPAFTGVDVSPEMVIEMAENGWIQGIKLTSHDFQKLFRIIRKAPKGFSTMTGYDSLFMTTLIHGGAGGIIGSPNIIPQYVSKIPRILDQVRVKEALTIQSAMMELADEFGLGTFPSAVKYLVEKAYGMKPHVRPPLMPLSGAEAEILDRTYDSALRQLQAIGYP